MLLFLFNIHLTDRFIFSVLPDEMPEDGFSVGIRVGQQAYCGDQGYEDYGYYGYAPTHQ